MLPIAMRVAFSRCHVARCSGAGDQGQTGPSFPAARTQELSERKQPEGGHRCAFQAVALMDLGRARCSKRVVPSVLVLLHLAFFHVVSLIYVYVPFRV